MTKKEKITQAEYDPLIPSPRMFWEFCSVRMQEWWRRTLEIEPYTADPVLLRKSIPNVFRELDYETHWLNSEMKFRNTADAIMATVSFRLTNRVPPHQLFGGPPRVGEVKDFQEHLFKMKNIGEPIFTRIFHTPSIWALVESLQEIEDNAQMLSDEVDSAKTLEEAFNVLKKIPRISNFFAWQCSADLIESGHLERFDEDTWVYLGPGPIRALLLMYGRKMNQNEAMKYAWKFWEFQDKALVNTRTPWKPPPHIHRFTMKNIEHAMCEYLRWVNAHWGGRYS